MIEVRGLVKRYGNHTAVDNLSFTVEKGQIYGFLGPNGAGKSTTMNIMTGYIGPTEGQVLINGHDILEEPEKAKRSIGYLPEVPPLYTEMTAREYLEFAGELKKLPKPEIPESVSEVIKLTGLEPVEHRLIRNMSKGYRQRVGLAQAILGFPEVIILDEPTAGLDPNQILEIRELIRSLAGKHTIILSSHILSEVQELCTQILIIHHGRLIANGSPQELERQMSGSRLEAIIKAGSAEKVRQALCGVAGIKNVTCADKPENGGYRVHIEPESDEDIREKVFAACVKAKCPLLMLQPENVSLENVFIRLTADEAVYGKQLENSSEENTPVPDKAQKSGKTREGDDDK